MNKYLCYVVGEKQSNTINWHKSSIDRLKTFAIALHLPVALWLITGFAISIQIFELSLLKSILVSLTCGLFIYLIERLVISSPKNRLIVIFRLIIAFLIAFIGASSFDLVLFDKEISTQLIKSGQNEISKKFDPLLSFQRHFINEKQQQWILAEEKALCEANGKCGSGVRNVGPVYREAKRHADALRGDLDSAEQKLKEIEKSKNDEINKWNLRTDVLKTSGLLTRVQALHDYVVNDFACFVTWSLFLLLVVCIESLVIVVKLSFNDTIDDEIERMKERIDHFKVKSYADAVTSPFYDANQLINSL